MKKYIHYCWFGGKPLPKLAKKCIKSWKKYLPDYEIIRWSEENVDLEECPFIKEAYENKKWAFVADYARTKAIYEYGGIYFDTDMEVVKNIDELLNTGNDHAAYVNDDHELSGGKAFLFTLITCGIYGLYWNYKMGKELYEAKCKKGMNASDNSVLYLILAVLGLGIVNYCLIQSDLNDFATVEK